MSDRKKVSDHLTLTNISFILTTISFMLVYFSDNLSNILSKHEIMGIVLNTISIIFGFFITRMNFIILTPCLPTVLRVKKRSTSPNLV
ncbi:hypothetical protein SAMN05216216_110106 [Lacicoccus qingdaonensis]|uniref:Uncharacterized protein n=1 Tax=Lacicoccus qingdaonensis TaxID=576118 RepID=A0A1G9F467_9BACL|nr:hypothetical protein SAMN05216216_110106 [Salinicoccus qingdaonensis]